METLGSILECPEPKFKSNRIGMETRRARRFLCPPHSNRTVSGWKLDHRFELRLADIQIEPYRDGNPCAYSLSCTCRFKSNRIGMETFRPILVSTKNNSNRTVSGWKRPCGDLLLGRKKFKSNRIGMETELGPVLAVVLNSNRTVSGWKLMKMSVTVRSTNSNRTVSGWKLKGRAEALPASYSNWTASGWKLGRSSG